jgi:hypothetical protein
VKCLNNAAGQAVALPYPSSAGDIVTNVSAAANGLDQLFSQLADFYEKQV